jgi:hypothetical protein
VKLSEPAGLKRLVLTVNDYYRRAELWKMRVVLRAASGLDFCLLLSGSVR